MADECIAERPKNDSGETDREVAAIQCVGEHVQLSSLLTI